MQINIRIDNSELIGNREYILDSQDIQFQQAKNFWEEVETIEYGMALLDRLLTQAKNEHKTRVDTLPEDETEEDHDCKDEKCTHKSHEEI